MRYVAHQYPKTLPHRSAQATALMPCFFQRETEEKARLRDISLGAVTHTRHKARLRDTKRSRTKNPHTGCKTGLNHLSRRPSKTAHRSPARHASRRPLQGEAGEGVIGVTREDGGTAGASEGGVVRRPGPAGRTRRRLLQYRVLQATAKHARVVALRCAVTLLQVKSLSWSSQSML
jgi:hypothetical protein